MYVKLNDRIAWERAECERTCGIMDIVSDAGFFSCYWPGFNPAHPDVAQRRLSLSVAVRGGVSTREWVMGGASWPEWPLALEL